jgi:hypothetical protein
VHARVSPGCATVLRAQNAGRTCTSGLSATGSCAAPNAQQPVSIVRRIGDITSSSAALPDLDASASASSGLPRSFFACATPRAVSAGSRRARASSALPTASSALCSASPCRTNHTVFAAIDRARADARVRPRKLLYCVPTDVHSPVSRRIGSRRSKVTQLSAPFRLDVVKR